MGMVVCKCGKTQMEFKKLNQSSFPQGWETDCCAGSKPAPEAPREQDPFEEINAQPSEPINMESEPLSEEILENAVEKAKANLSPGEEAPKPKKARKPRKKKEKKQEQGKPDEQGNKDL